GLLLHREDDGGLAPVSGITPFDPGRKIDARDLTQQYWLILAIGDHGVTQVLEPPGDAEITNEIFAALLIHETAGRVGAEARDAPRKLVAHEREALGNQLTVAEDVGAPIEFNVDNRQADARDRAHARHPGHPVHDAFDRKGDELLDLLGRQSLRLRDQGDDGP